MDDNSNSGSDEAVWFSFLCAAVAFFAAYRFPSLGMNLILLLMVSWFLWMLFKMSAERFD